MPVPIQTMGPDKPSPTSLQRVSIFVGLFRGVCRWGRLDFELCSDLRPKEPRHPTDR